MEENQQGSPLSDPAEAARRLQLSGAGLRRLAAIYEQVCGKLPRDNRNGRLWTEDAIERLGRARAMVQSGRSPSVEAALVAEQAGEGVDPYPAPRSAAERLSASLLEEIRGLRKAVEHQNTLLAKQTERLDALEAASAAPGSPETDAEDAGSDDVPDEPQQPGERRSWWQRFFGGS